MGLITHLEPNEIFVFGSNLNGHHSAGAAKWALSDFGAQEGIGEGLTGQSYAFPTLDTKFRKRRIVALTESKYKLYLACIRNPEKRFLLTKVGCGIAGFTEKQMRTLFTDPPANLVLPEDWRQHVEAS